MANPAIIQQADNAWPGQSTAGDPQSLTETLTMPGSVTAGNSIVVFAVTFNLGQTGHTITITDNQGNTWPAASRSIDDLTENLSWFVFCLPRLGSSGSYTITGHYDLLEYQSLFMMEISNLDVSPVIATNAQIQNPTNTTADQLTPGSLAGGTNQGIVLAISENTADGNSIFGTDVGSPNVGTGWTSINAGIVDWLGRENTHIGPSAATEYKLFTSAMGTVTPSFTPKLGSERFVTIAIALKASAAGFPLLQLLAAAQGNDL
jgi:hypothetical protein